MPETQEIVINTGSLIALIAGLQDLSFLKALYKRILFPFEVCREIEAGGLSGFGVIEFISGAQEDKKALGLQMTWELP
jgi:predicted nucleic acid-binding protein